MASTTAASHLRQSGKAVRTLFLADGIPSHVFSSLPGSASTTTPTTTTTAIDGLRSLVTGGLRGGRRAYSSLGGGFAGITSRATTNNSRRVVRKAEGSFGRSSANKARTFASGGSSSGKEVVHEGLKLHETGGWHKTVGETLSSVMWFWVFYRLYHDYEGFLFGHVGHHEHMLHEEAGEAKDGHH